MLMPVADKKALYSPKKYKFKPLIYKDIYM